MSTFAKREKEKKRQQKKLEKQRRKEERKANATDGSLESMMAYVDENGMLSDTPPDPNARVEIDASEIVLGIPPKEEGQEDPTKTGKLDFFDYNKGFGFINETGGQGRYFVHISNIQEEIREGERVSFELERGPRGMNAVRVKKA
ncbi:MAG: cold shock domain-containing protein [Flavobacteriales bacterium]|nr:cold shock domain-containing protein [Flavobacteriales bacterium]MEB2342898.1 cold shock domain-containing protein [Flavobacteriia bacterium]